MRENKEAAELDLSWNHLVIGLLY